MVFVATFPTTLDFFENRPSSPSSALIKQLGNGSVAGCPRRVLRALSPRSTALRRAEAARHRLLALAHERRGRAGHSGQRLASPRSHCRATPDPTPRPPLSRVQVPPHVLEARPAALIDKLRRLFLVFEPDGVDGTVPFHACLALLRVLGFNPSESDVLHCCSVHADLLPASCSQTPASAAAQGLPEARVRQAGRMTFADFSVVWDEFARGSSARVDRHLLEMAFEAFDLDGSGDVELAEMAVVLRTLGSPPLTEAEIETFFRFVDADGSGGLDLSEFVRFFSDELADSEGARRAFSTRLQRAELQPSVAKEAPKRIPSLRQSVSFKARLAGTAAADVSQRTVSRVASGMHRVASLAFNQPTFSGVAGEMVSRAELRDARAAAMRAAGTGEGSRSQGVATGTTGAGAAGSSTRAGALTPVADGVISGGPPGGDKRVGRKILKAITGKGFTQPEDEQWKDASFIFGSGSLLPAAVHGADGNDGIVVTQTNADGAQPVGRSSSASSSGRSRGSAREPMVGVLGSAVGRQRRSTAGGDETFDLGADRARSQKGESTSSAAPADGSARGSGTGTGEPPGGGARKTRPRGPTWQPRPPSTAAPGTPGGAGGGTSASWVESASDVRLVVDPSEAGGTSGAGDAGEDSGEAPYPGPLGTVGEGRDSPEAPHRDTPEPGRPSAARSLSESASRSPDGGDEGGGAEGAGRGARALSQAESTAVRCGESAGRAEPASGAPSAREVPSDGDDDDSPDRPEGRGPARVVGILARVSGALSDWGSRRGSPRISASGRSVVHPHEKPRPGGGEPLDRGNSDNSRGAWMPALSGGDGAPSGGSSIHGASLKLKRALSIGILRRKSRRDRADQLMAPPGDAALTALGDVRVGDEIARLLADVYLPAVVPDGRGPPLRSPVGASSGATRRGDGPVNGGREDPRPSFETSFAERGGASGQGGWENAGLAPPAWATNRPAATGLQSFPSSSAVHSGRFPGQPGNNAADRDSSPSAPSRADSAAQAGAGLGVLAVGAVSASNRSMGTGVGTTSRGAAKSARADVTGSPAAGGAVAGLSSGLVPLEDAVVRRTRSQGIPRGVVLDIGRKFDLTPMGADGVGSLALAASARASSIAASVGLPPRPDLDPAENPPTCTAHGRHWAVARVRPPLDDVEAASAVDGVVFDPRSPVVRSTCAAAGMASALAAEAARDRVLARMPAGPNGIDRSATLVMTLTPDDPDHPDVCAADAACLFCPETERWRSAWGGGAFPLPTSLGGGGKAGAKLAGAADSKGSGRYDGGDLRRRGGRFSRPSSAAHSSVVVPSQQGVDGSPESGPGAAGDATGSLRGARPGPAGLPSLQLPSIGPPRTVSFGATGTPQPSPAPSPSALLLDMFAAAGLPPLPRIQWPGRKTAHFARGGQAAALASASHAAGSFGRDSRAGTGTSSGDGDLVPGRGVGAGGGGAGVRGSLGRLGSGVSAGGRGPRGSASFHPDSRWAGASGNLVAAPALRGSGPGRLASSSMTGDVVAARIAGRGAGRGPSSQDDRTTAAGGRRSPSTWLSRLVAGRGSRAETSSPGAAGSVSTPDGTTQRNGNGTGADGADGASTGGGAPAGGGPALTKAPSGPAPSSTPGQAGKKTRFASHDEEHLVSSRRGAVPGA